MKPQPLTDNEFDQLSDILERFGGKRSLNLEQLDGFLAAVVCGPDVIPQREYLRAIWGDDIINEDAFAAQPILRDFISLVVRHHDFIDHTLREGDVFTPLITLDEDGDYHGNDWANGFLRGTELRKADWALLMDDEEEGGALVPIFALAYENDPDPELRSYSEPVSSELRQKLLIGAAAGVMRMFHYFEAQRLLQLIEADHSSTYRRIAPKVGRNDKCPCGSSKKYKHCCGRNTLH
jgi:uncharacterized protein